MKAKIKVTRDWAKTHLACRKSVRRFFEHWPRGLTLNRRNLYVVAENLPVSDLYWFVRQLRFGNQLSNDQVDRLAEFAVSPEGNWVTSPAKKQAVAKALADALNL